MSSTTYTAGTVIASTWLNEVNDIVQDGISNSVFYSGSYSTLQAALTAAAGATLVIAPGTHVCTALSVPANTTVLAYGATLDFSAAGNITAVTLASGCVWHGGTLTGPGGTTYAATGQGFYCAGTNNNPAAPTYITAPKIENVTIHGFAYSGVWLEYTEYGHVLHCHIYDCGYVGIAGLSCSYVNYDRNTVHDIAGVGAPDTYGMFFSAHELSETAAPRSHHCSMSFNHVYNIPHWEAIDTHGDTDITIHGNTIEGCRFGIMVLSGDTLGVESRGPKRVAVTGNTIKGVATSDPLLSGGAIVVKGAPIEYAEEIVIANNSILYGGTPNTTSEGSIRVYDAYSLSITGNVIREPYVWGINLIRNLSCVTVSGNTIIDPRDDTYATPGCIFINSHNVKGSIHGNTFAYKASGAGTYVAIRSIAILSFITGLELTIGHNSFVGESATKLTFVPGTTTGLSVQRLTTQSGSGTLASGTLTVVFTKVFPATPKCFVTNTSDLNPVRVSAISATQVTFTGTGTTAFSWEAFV